MNFLLNQPNLEDGKHSDEGVWLKSSCKNNKFKECSVDSFEMLRTTIDTTGVEDWVKDGVHVTCNCMFKNNQIIRE